ncbi:hypothetical protein [Halobacteriovorax sp.]|uniref:hypothetical protein n=1 Tax=Halobacteriovorax sp. TaxID=2020862 RepID=UPI003AF27D83
MNKLIALTFITLLTLTTYAVCNTGGTFNCESYTDNDLYGLVLDPWQVYEGRYSCVSWSTRYYYNDIEDISVNSSMTLEINFKTDSSAELDIKAITSNGVQHVQRTRSHVVYDAVDGERWYWHTYRLQFNRSTTLEQFRIHIPRFVNIDEFEWNLAGASQNNRYLSLKNQSDFNYAISEQDIISQSLKNWTIDLEGVFGANDEALIKLEPNSIAPFYAPNCKEITQAQVNVATNEQGNDSFTIECVTPPTPLGNRITYLRIKNNTSKTYCSAINFSIETKFDLTISDKVESTNYTEKFDIITSFD